VSASKNDDVSKANSLQVQLFEETRGLVVSVVCRSCLDWNLLATIKSVPVVHFCLHSLTCGALGNL
jgi:hypothetical protein